MKSGGKKPRWEISIDEVQETLIKDLVILEENHEKGIKQFAPNVRKNAKFHFNQRKEEMFFAMVVGEKEDLDNSKKE